MRWGAVSEDVACVEDQSVLTFSFLFGKEGGSAGKTPHLYRLSPAGIETATHIRCVKEGDLAAAWGRLGAPAVEVKGDKQQKGKKYRSQEEEQRRCFPETVHGFHHGGIIQNSSPIGRTSTKRGIGEPGKRGERQGTGSMGAWERGSMGAWERGSMGERQESGE
jgi:hypothetical protein